MPVARRPNASAPPVEGDHRRETGCPPKGDDLEAAGAKGTPPRVDPAWSQEGAGTSLIGERIPLHGHGCDGSVHLEPERLEVVTRRPSGRPPRPWAGCCRVVAARHPRRTPPFRHVG